MADEYDVLKPFSYKPAGGGKSVDVDPNVVDTVDDLTPAAAAWLVGQGAIELTAIAELPVRRDELNKAAANAGVENPERLPNREAVIAAIAKAREGDEEGTTHA